MKERGVVSINELRYPAQQRAYWCALNAVERFCQPGVDAGKEAQVLAGVHRGVKLLLAAVAARCPGIA